jgi:hypothetical protein
VRGPADIALAATLHDASGALAADIESGLPRLGALYRAILVTTTPSTVPRIRTLLDAAGVYAGTPATDAHGPLYRLALRRASVVGAGHVHYVDFDRALHWIRRAPRELAAVLRAARSHALVLLGRTAKAHRSHHRPLHATEVVANRLFAERLGIAGRVDFLVPSFVVRTEVATRLLGRSRARGPAMYGEWAALLAGLGSEIAYRECRGLDWETPDRHRAAVRRLGLPAWRRRQDTATEWTRRVDMAAEFVRGFARGLERWPAGRVVMRRLSG